MKHTVRKRKQTRGGLLFWAVALVVVLASGSLLYTMARPFWKAYQMRAENEQIRRQTLALQLEQQRLKRQQQVLGTPRGPELEARRLGYLRPGERALVIPGP